MTKNTCNIHVGDDESFKHNRIHCLIIVFNMSQLSSSSITNERFTSTSHFLNLKLVDSKPWLMTMSLCWFDNTICLFLISNLCLEFKIQVTVIILYLSLKLVLNFSDKFDKKIFLCISLNLLLIIRSSILCLWYSMVQEKCINELELSFLLSRTEARVKLFV